jgi:UDP-glucose-4-epimerase GalE
MSILVTGAAGYIGSHAVKALLARGQSVVGIDNFSEGKRGAVIALTGLPGAADRFTFHECDIADADNVDHILRDHTIDSVVHFAAFANLRESMTQPLKYFTNNTAKAIALLEACDHANIRSFIFSSTCATYGDLPPSDIPVTEDYPNRKPINPYGHSKLALEFALEDYAAARKAAGRPFAMSILRYFNVAGCDAEGILGEDRTPHIRIIPILIEAALGRRPGVTIFGTDYPTPDGTCVRDYIHVDDLVDAHLAVLDALDPDAYDTRIYNLGIGKGDSIRELIDATQRVTGVTLNVSEGPRAPGDPANLYCNPAKIEREIGWKAKITDVDRIIATAHNWMKAHPNGFET